MASSSRPHLLPPLKIFIVFTFVLSLTEAETKHGFTVEIIHRDSPKSPFYNHSSKPLSPYQKVNNAALRSFKRLNNSFFPNSKLALDDDIGTEAILSEGEYLMEYFLGTPAKQKYGMIDTGSGLIWLQCVPCEKCFKTQVPLFNPSSSTTFLNTSCDSAECNAARKEHNVNCDGSTNQCLYEIEYEDGASSKGRIVKDTITLRRSNGGRKVAFPRTIFGCAHFVDGSYSRKSSGMVGLGRGPLSLISQMGYDFRGKFSYCLVPFTFSSDKISKLSFGQNAFAYDFATVSTPIAAQFPDLYYLTLEGVSVGEARLEYKAEKEGNIIIDNGSALTYLPQDLMYKLAAEVVRAIHPKFRRVHVKNFDLCFSSSSEEGGFEDFVPPIITFHFKWKADVKLYSSNTFTKTSDESMCLTMVSSQESYIFGIWAQTNYLVGYDLLSSLVSFKARDCSL